MKILELNLSGEFFGFIIQCHNFGLAGLVNMDLHGLQPPDLSTPGEQLCILKGHAGQLGCSGFLLREFTIWAKIQLESQIPLISFSF